MTPFQTIVKMVLAETGLRWAHITGDGRKQGLAKAKWAICWALRETTGMSFTMIADKLCRDCSVTRYGYLRAEQWRESDPAFKAFTDRLVAAVPDREVPE